MKKLSTIIALALVITIGGVYAAWNYSQGQTAATEVTREINMAQVSTTGTKGSFAVTPGGDFAFLVDNAGNYVATLTGTGYIDVIFTPNAGVDTNVQENGIPMKATVTVTHVGSTAPTYNYGGINVIPLVAKEGENVITLNGGTATKTARITATDIIGCLDFAVNAEVEHGQPGHIVDGFALPTYQSNQDFHTVLKNYTIMITISEAI